MAEPHRTCVGCRSKRAQSALIRFRADAAGQVVLGPGGRGGWLCLSSPVVCLDEAVRRNALGRALRVRVDSASIPALRKALDVVRPDGGARLLRCGQSVR